MATGVELPIRKSYGRDDYLNPPLVPTRSNRNRERNGTARNGNSQTPPPNYEEYLSENDLPSARTQVASGLLKSNGSHKGSSYSYSRVCTLVINSL